MKSVIQKLLLCLGITVGVLGSYAARSALKHYFYPPKPYVESKEAKELRVETQRQMDSINQIVKKPDFNNVYESPKLSDTEMSEFGRKLAGVADTKSNLKHPKCPLTPEQLKKSQERRLSDGE